MTVNHGVAGSSPARGANKKAFQKCEAFFCCGFMYCVYIIHSVKLNRFYIGTTDNFILRFEQHNNAVHKNAFTAKGIPWTKFLVIENLNSKQAFSVESHIKRMKSKQYIQNLVKYPEIKNKVVKLYNI
ncbi:MAG: GIY-YIG nuclease family protein [Bacteroidota bacterium]